MKIRQESIVRFTQLTLLIKPIKKVPIYSNCGLKEEKVAGKCSVCKSPYILA